MRYRPLRTSAALALAGACLLSTMCTSPAGTPSPSPTPTRTPVAIGCQKSVEAMKALTQGLDLPEHLAQQNASRTGEEFDVNRYFSVLTHLSMSEGTVLDYVYSFDGMGGSPILYARAVDEPQLLTTSEYATAVEEGRLAKGWDAYLRSVQADGSEEGFFELAVLRVMGNQFYLFWHAGYNDDRIVCNSEALESIVSDLGSGGFGNPLPVGALLRARALDLEPTVELSADKAAVRFVTFTKWGGFYRRTFTISRSFPHSITEEEPENLVEYDCGIMF